MELLKLCAMDAEDLAIISAHLQDAVIRVGDIHYLKGQAKLALLARRFAWETAQRGDGSYERRLAGLQLARVRSVRSRRVAMNDPDGVVSLLAVSFEPEEPPSGRIVLTLAGGGVIVAEVECIEASLEDMGPAWETRSRPSHPLE